MQATELSGSLRKWAHEFSGFSGQPVSAPEKLWDFLAARISESGAVEPDQDTVMVRLFSSTRRIRITGTHGEFMTYEATDGSLGSGLCRMSDVMESDRGRLTGILERLVRDGKIRQVS